MNARGAIVSCSACVALAIPTAGGALPAGDPTAGPVPSHIDVWFTDAADRRLTELRPGQFVRIRSNWGRVCVRRTDGSYCANPMRAPSWLERRARPNLVIDGRVWATSGGISGPSGSASIPVRRGSS